MPGHNPTRITVLISGSGTNLQALIDACNQGSLERCSIIRVISNRKAAKGLLRAEAASIPTTYHNLTPYKARYPSDIILARSEYDKDLASLILAEDPHIAVCAGWMHILAPAFLDAMAAANVPVINLHPALPGQFNGAHAIERAHAAWMEGRIEKTGVMIHKVIGEVDMGEPILVDEIEFVKGEDENMARFEAKLHEREWKAIVKGTRMAIERYCHK